MFYIFSFLSLTFLSSSLICPTQRPSSSSFYPCYQSMSLPGFAAVVSALLCPLPPPFILELPVLVLHAVGCGVSSVGTRALDLSHWGGSELREANPHSGKPFCQSASLWLRFSVSSYLPFYILTSSVLPLS